MDYKNIYNELFQLLKGNKNSEFMEKINRLIEDDSTFDINITDSSGKHFLNYAVIMNNIDMVTFLIKKGIRIDIENDEISIMTIAIFYSYNEILEILLNEDKKSIGVGLINYRDKNNRTPLHYAIISKNMDAIDLLLKYDANVNIVDKDKYNALFFAVKSRSFEICQKIIRLTSNINAKCLTGENVLHIACNLRLYDIGELLIKNKININVHDNNNELTPLHYCVLLNDIKMTNLIIENGGNINLQDIYGNTPLHYSIIENNYEIFNILINSMKNNNVNVNLWNIEGEIPLHLLFKLKEKENNNNNYFDLLLEKSNLNIQDKDGNSCFYYLLKFGIWKKYIHILKKKKINIFIKNKENEYIFDVIEKMEKKEDTQLIYDLLSESYLYTLKNTSQNWTEEIDIICSKTLDNLTDSERKKIFNKKDNIISSTKLINSCKKHINQKINDIINNIKNQKDVKCYEKSYPMLKPPICIEISEGKNIQFCTFTGSLLDILIGLVFLNKKYNEYVCSIISDEINKKDLCHKYKLNNIISNNNKCELINFELIWSNKKLNFGNNFINNFLSCMENKKKRFIIIPLGIEMKEGSHAGYMIYDIQEKELERFETYGGGTSLYGTYYDSALLDEKIEERFKELDENIKYIKPYDFLPKISFQLMDISEKTKKKIGDPFGFCALWSIWYVDNRIKYKEIPREQLVKILIKDAKAKNISFKNLIRNYAINIIEIRDQILSKANMDINDWINEQYTEEQFVSVLSEINKIMVK
jgi:ankyrin repeat protein